jgi:ABC-type polysaccharide/polyol phosphate transport system ATPase subunit
MENIYLNASILGLSRKEVDRRLSSIIDFSELGHFIDLPIRTYSSGMTARLGFAVAVHTDPDLLLIDEVLGVGDAAFQEKCAQRIGQFKEDGKTIVFVSHSPEAVERVAARAIWIESGIVRANGPVAQIMDEYVSTCTDETVGGKFDVC